MEESRISDSIPNLDALLLAQGNFLRDRREALGLSRTRFGCIAGLNYNTVASIEEGVVKPRYETLNRYAKALGLDRDDFRKLIAYDFQNIKVGNPVKHHIVAVVIVGTMYSGKSFVANLIRAKSKLPFKLHSVAGKLKELYCEYTGISLEELDHNKAAHRKGLQDLGSALRSYSSDFLVKIWANTAPAYALIDDIRYRNEYEYINSMYKYVIPIHITASSQVRRKRKGGELTTEETTHTSETTDWTTVCKTAPIKIENSGTKDDLLPMLDLVINQLERVDKC